MYNDTERLITKQIFKYLEPYPVWARKIHGGPYQQHGIPDIIICINGEFVALEVKTKKGVVSDLQEYCMKQINNAGGKAYVVRSLEDAKEVLSPYLEKLECKITTSA